MGAKLIRQTWAVSAVLLNMVGHGMVMSHTTCLLPALQDPQSTIRADLNTASLLASLAGLASLPGYLVSSVLMDIYGRKRTHIFMSLPVIIGWVAIFFAQSIPVLMIGRTLAGFSTGATVLLGATVIGEYSDPRYRGVFLNLKTVAFGIGGGALHVLCHVLSWRNIALCAAFPHVLAIFINFTWPESPPWLASKGKFDESKNSFFWLRENSEASNNELNELIKAQTIRLAKPELVQNTKMKIIAFLKKFTEKDFLKPIFIVILSVALLETSGRHLFPAYALQIIGEMAGSKSQSFYYTLGIDIIITGSAVLSSILVKIMKRRVLLFTTGFAACAFLMIACIYITLLANNIITNGQSWLAIAIFIVYFFLANLGCSPIPLALLGEIFPLHHRQFGSAIAGIWMSLSLMLTLYITPQLLANIKVHGTFFVYGAATGLVLLILYFVLPETKDRTLQEIEDYFNYGKYRDVENLENEATKSMIKEQDQPTDT